MEQAIKPRNGTLSYTILRSLSLINRRKLGNSHRTPFRHCRLVLVQILSRLIVLTINSSQVLTANSITLSTKYVRICALVRARRRLPKRFKRSLRVLIRGVQGILGVVLIHRIERIVRIELVNRIGRVVPVKLVDGIEWVIRIKLICGVQRVV